MEASADVSTFQERLQDLLVKRADATEPDWKHTFSPRIEARKRPLLSII